MQKLLQKQKKKKMGNEKKKAMALLLLRGILCVGYIVVCECVKERGGSLLLLCFFRREKGFPGHLVLFSLALFFIWVNLLYFFFFDILAWGV